jgi:DNA-binding MarR family transcriptional regulator
MGAHTSGELRRSLDHLRRIVQALRTTGLEAERAVGLSGAQLFVLQQLAEHSPLSVNELAARVHTHQSSVSTIAARLAEQGLVLRRPSTRDRRRVELSLTLKGRRLLEQAPTTAQEKLVLALRSMPAGDRAVFGRGLARLAAALGDRGAPPLFFEEHPRTRRARS